MPKKKTRKKKAVQILNPNTKRLLKKISEAEFGVKKPRGKKGR